MIKKKIIVRTKSKSYPIYFGDKIFISLQNLIKKNLPYTKKVFVVIDKNLPISVGKELNKSLKKYNPKIYKMHAREKFKNIDTANLLIENLLKNNLNRSDCIIAIGGGIITDLSAFVASVTKRGLRLINIPTTLLSQVDASIGGKTGVNTNQGKNLIGTFYQPDFVLIDTSMLNTLPKREIICGYAEILKHALIKDKKFFLWLSKNGKKIIYNRDKNLLQKAIIKSCKIKAQIVNKDEKENNLRMILNFGHTFAHSFEAANKFSKKLNHGEAVLLGMIVASKYSCSKNLLQMEDLSLIKDHYTDLNLPTKLSFIFKRNQINKIASYATSDKKNMNKKINLILLKKIGKTTKPNTFQVSKKTFREILFSNYT